MLLIFYCLGLYALGFVFLADHQSGFSAAIGVCTVMTATVLGLAADEIRKLKRLREEDVTRANAWIERFEAELRNR